MGKCECEFPEYLVDGNPSKCSALQMCVCHQKSGGRHPLPSPEKMKEEREAAEKKD